MALDRNIWRSRISVGSKLRHYNSCILPIFLYGAETWAVTATAGKTYDDLDQWCLCRFLNIHWTERIANNEFRSRTQQPLLSDAVSSRRLRFFGDICRAGSFSGNVRQYYRSAQALEEKTRPAETDLVTNHREWSGDSSTACAEQNSLADTRGNGYVADKLRMMMMITFATQTTSISRRISQNPSPIDVNRV